MKENRMVVYGTLRPKDYNFTRFGRGLKSISEGYIRGYRLYDLGPYPCCVYTGDKDDIVAVSLIEAQDEKTAKYIDAMEIGAGYFISEAELFLSSTANVPEGTYKVFLFKKEEGNLIESGDWYNKKFRIVKANRTSGTKKYRESADDRSKEVENFIHRAKNIVFFNEDEEDVTEIENPF